MIIYLLRCMPYFIQVGELRAAICLGGYFIGVPQTLVCYPWSPVNSWDVIKWKHFPRYWPFVRIIHRSPVNSPHKGQWRGALIFSLICALNKRLSKQWWCWWFETPSCPLWRHCNVLVLCKHEQCVPDEAGMVRLLSASGRYRRGSRPLLQHGLQSDQWYCWEQLYLKTHQCYH